MPDPNTLTIRCAEHGVTPYCLICQHLRDESGLWYFAIPAEVGEPAQAWCESCDKVLEQEQGWTDRADLQANWRLYCTVCYEATLRRHRLRSWIEGASPDG
jgi:hypothetical protein